MEHFEGCPEDMYQFFWEIAFQNHREFFEANRERYHRVVKKPMLALAEQLLPTALEIDPGFNPRPSSVVSRIRRDTRYTKDKSPYRDHVWLGFKPAGRHTSECFSIYVEFERTSYGYGMGDAWPDPAQMARIRERILAQPKNFLALINEPAFAERFRVEGIAYRRPKFTDCSAELSPWLNRRSLYFCYSSPAISRTYSPDILEELLDALNLMRPVYRFLMGLD